MSPLRPCEGGKGGVNASASACADFWLTLLTVRYIPDIMFAKVFNQIFDSSIAEDYTSRHVFIDLLILADKDGVVDKTQEAIARITNAPLKVVTQAIEVLSKPDRKSRTKDEDGRRLVLIDKHRDWGWRIVNYQKYRDIHNEEARRAANRTYKRDQRAREREPQTKKPRAPRRKSVAASVGSGIKPDGYYSGGA